MTMQSVYKTRKSRGLTAHCGVLVRLSLMVLLVSFFNVSMQAGDCILENIAKSIGFEQPATVKN